MFFQISCNSFNDSFFRITSAIYVWRLNTQLFSYERNIAEKCRKYPIVVSTVKISLCSIAFTDFRTYIFRTVIIVKKIISPSYIIIGSLPNGVDLRCLRGIVACSDGSESSGYSPRSTVCHNFRYVQPILALKRCAESIGNTSDVPFCLPESCISDFVSWRAFQKSIIARCSNQHRDKCIKCSLIYCLHISFLFKV